MDIHIDKKIGGLMLASLLVGILLGGAISIGSSFGRFHEGRNFSRHMMMNGGWGYRNTIPVSGQTRGTQIQGNLPVNQGYPADENGTTTQ